MPWELSEQAWHLFALFFGAILAVLLSALPILVASLIAVILAVFTNTLTTEKAFSGFSESFMLLILAAFLVAKAVIKSGLGRRVSLPIPGPTGRRWSREDRSGPQVPGDRGPHRWGNPRTPSRTPPSPARGRWINRSVAVLL